jgi:DNA modification methylase
MDLVDGDTDHPYEKPTTLIRRLILNHTSPGMTILDPFMGSGTIGVVAEVLGRGFIGLEQSPSIFNRAQMRIMGGLS